MKRTRGWNDLATRKMEALIKEINSEEAADKYIKFKSTFKEVYRNMPKHESRDKEPPVEAYTPDLNVMYGGLTLPSQVAHV